MAFGTDSKSSEKVPQQMAGQGRRPPPPRPRGSLPSPSSLDTNPDNTVRRERERRPEPVCRSAGPCADRRRPPRGWGGAAGTLTLGAQAEVRGGRAVLVLDGAAVHSAVHGGRLHDGQGRRPLVPCAAERRAPRREGRHLGTAGAERGLQAPPGGAQRLPEPWGGRRGRTTQVWLAVMTLTSCETLGTSEPRSPPLYHETLVPVSALPWGFNK